jgi:hypothetical protein
MTTANTKTGIAEKFLTDDTSYADGTILMFGGASEVTIAGKYSHKIAGVVCSDPAYLNNSDLSGDTIKVCINGTTNVKVLYSVSKGDIIVSGENGLGLADNSDTVPTGCAVGKALEAFTSDGSTIGTIRVSVDKS